MIKFRICASFTQIYFLTNVSDIWEFFSWAPYRVGWKLGENGKGKWEKGGLGGEG